MTEIRRMQATCNGNLLDNPATPAIRRKIGASGVTSRASRRWHTGVPPPMWS